MGNKTKFEARAIIHNQKGYKYEGKILKETEMIITIFDDIEERQIDFPKALCQVERYKR